MATALNKKICDITVLPASFRDPSGFLFKQNGTLYRQINKTYQKNYDLLMRSGLYDSLTTGQGMMITHQEVDNEISEDKNSYKIIAPETVNFISYPYEWGFNQLKDAALLTLKIQKTALEYNMTLKDASLYNIQFHNGNPVIIDTLSFEKYEEGKPWSAYRQFCQHFLATLALMAKTDLRLNKLLLAYIDGIPLDLASKLLPQSSWFKPGLLTHLHIHAKTQKAYSRTDSTGSKKKVSVRKISKAVLLEIINGLYKTVEKLNCRFVDTEWADYYHDTNYTQSAFQGKKEIVQQFINRIRPGGLWDLGANTGVFSRIASQMNIPVISFDIDPVAVDINYLRVKKDNEKWILPLILDLTNPSPGLGWDENERDSFSARGPVDCVLALALIHHLAISNNVPFEKIALFFKKICKALIIEFVPKDDSQVTRLLSSRDDIFPEYDQSRFESAFKDHFTIVSSVPVENSKRVLYLMQRR